MLGGAGLAAGATVGALLAEDMLGRSGLAGLPVAVLTAGSALAAYLIGRLTEARGRRPGLAAGFVVGGIGGLGVIAAAVLGNVALLFGSLFVYARGHGEQPADPVHGCRPRRPGAARHRGEHGDGQHHPGGGGRPRSRRSVGPVGHGLGHPALAGPFLLASVTYLTAGAVLWLLLRPDPSLLGRRLAADTGETEPGAAESTTADAPPRPGPRAWVGAGVMVTAQVVMVAIMTMTPVHMRAHDHDLEAVGFVIGLHIAAMYLPSLVTGRLIDRTGKLVMAAASGLTLLLAGVVAALAPGESLWWLVLALVLLDLGWNLGVISGTALVVDGTDPSIRPRTQGAVDVLIALSGATAGASSGVVAAAASFPGLALLGAALGQAMLPVLRWGTVRASR